MRIGLRSLLWANVNICSIELNNYIRKKKVFKKDNRVSKGEEVESFNTQKYMRKLGFCLILKKVRCHLVEKSRFSLTSFAVDTVLLGIFFPTPFDYR